MITTENYEEWMMLAADGELDEAGIAALNAFLAEHPRLAAAAEAWAGLRLEPDMEVVYEGKAALLRRGPKSIRIGWGRASLAAAAAVLAGMLIIPRFMHQSHSVQSIVHRFNAPARSESAAAPKMPEPSIAAANVPPLAHRMKHSGIAKAKTIIPHEPVSMPAQIAAASDRLYRAPKVAERINTTCAIPQPMPAGGLAVATEPRFPDVHFAAANQPAIEALRNALDDRYAQVSAAVKAVKAARLYVKLGNKPIRISF